MTKPTPADLRHIFTALKPVEDTQLLFLIDNSEFIHLKQDEFLYKPDDEAKYMHLMVSGAIRLYGIQNDKVRQLFLINAGDITSLLPYSRMEKHLGFGQATQDCHILAFPKDKMSLLIQDNYQLTEALVHLMSTRIREFTTTRLQDEKMLALGKLSAGLAHEMNNPASAIVRSSKELLSHLKQEPEHFKKVMQMNLSSSDVEAVTKLLFDKIGTREELKIGIMQRQELEDELTDCLIDFDVEDSEQIAESLTDFGFSCDDLHRIQVVTREHFPTVMRWIDESLTTEKMVRDIEEASSRISELVKSVKNFTHMDRSTDRSPIDLHNGIESTLTMLNHKVKSSTVILERKYADQLPSPIGKVGEVNQVWTNILDNALDALENTENARIEIETYADPTFVHVVIRDNGPGIPADVISNIFDPFFTTKDLGKGTGLGLEVVKGIVESHNGKIMVNSIPGKTEFEISFPIV